MSEPINNMINKLSSLSLRHSNDLFGGEGSGLDVIEVKHANCTATIALQGAQLLSFQATNREPLLWLSPNAGFVSGKAVRGGIPLCAPWFGPHPNDPNKPQHGFARNHNWILMKAEEDQAAVRLHFQYSSDDHQQILFPWPLRLDLEMTLGEGLELRFSATNEGNHSHGDMPFTFALHSYFPVDDCREVSVHGLKEVQTFNGEVDKLLTQVPNQQTIHNTGAEISITGDHCPSAIVWNPGAEKAAALKDLGEAHYHTFVCVERGAAGTDAWTLKPGETRQATLSLYR